MTEIFLANYNWVT